MDITCSENELELREKLINKILIASAVVAMAAFICAELRAFEIGWSYRDIFQFIAVGSLVVLALIRKKIKTENKALLLIIFYSTGAFPGVFSLGMLAGTMFVFPAAAVVIAVFYSVKATLMYIAATLLFCCLIAVKFCSNIGKLPFSADLLVTNYFHWIVYIVCIAFFFTITCLTIHDYRGAMKKLMAEVTRQRDELAKTNEELREAANNLKTLSGLLPICAYCKKIRNDEGYWNQIEHYIKEHSDATFSHGICPECTKSHYPEIFQKLQEGKNEQENRKNL